MHKAEACYTCKACDGILQVDYTYDGISAQFKSDQLKQTLIFHDQKTTSILGEGNTPTVELNKIARKLGSRTIYAKCEFLNPTGSFKDRPVAAGVQKAIKFGYKHVVVASSGNGAAAVAAYSARLNLAATILVPSSTPLEKVKQSQFYGSNVTAIEGPYSNSFKRAREMSEKEDYYNLTTTFINPYTVEGDKGIAYEVHHEVESWPDYIVVPIGAGPLLVGIYRGFMELNQLFGLKRTLPKMIGVQAEGCAPIARAFQEKRRDVIAEKKPQTIASGIGDGLDGYSHDGTYTLSIIRASNGSCIAVSDKDILASQKELAQEEGIFVEPSSASALAAIKKLVNKEPQMKEQSIMLILTGHGLKDMGVI